MLGLPSVRFTSLSPSAQVVVQNRDSECPGSASGSGLKVKKPVVLPLVDDPHWAVPLLVASAPPSGFGARLFRATVMDCRARPLVDGGSRPH